MIQLLGELRGSDGGAVMFIMSLLGLLDRHLAVKKKCLSGSSTGGVFFFRVVRALKWSRVDSLLNFFQVLFPQEYRVLYSTKAQDLDLPTHIF